MNARKLTFILAISMLALIVGLLGGTYLLTGVFKDKANDLSIKRANVEVLSDQESGIAKSKRDIASYTKLGDISKAIVPQDKDQAATVREINKLASSNGVTLTTITFPSSTLGNMSGGTAAKTASAATAAKPNLSQLTLVKDLPGVYNLQITLSNNSSNTVTYDKLIAFLNGLENNRRTAAVSSLNIQPQNSNPERLVFTLIINTYIKP